MKQKALILCCMLAVPLLWLSGCFAGEIQEAGVESPQVRHETVESQEQTDQEENVEPALPESVAQKPGLGDSFGEEPADTDFVRVADCLPEIVVDLRYATEDNFTGQVIYGFSDAWLRYGTVKKLAAAQMALAEQGYGLKIWDAFRPAAAQIIMWEICPDSVYVANPNRGFSSHSCGNTVDLTLIAADGTEAVMPTGFDDFSTKADRDYSDVDPEAASNALVLENAMIDAGFKPYSGEWWHFSDTDEYDLEEAFLPEEG